MIFSDEHHPKKTKNITLTDATDIHLQRCCSFFISHVPMYLTADLLYLNIPRVHVYDVILSLGTLYAYDVRKSMMQPSDTSDAIDIHYQRYQFL